MQPSARVLILAERDDVATSLALGLEGLGWRTATARTIEQAEVVVGDLATEVALVDARTALPPETADRLRAASAPRNLPVLAVGTGLAGADLSMTPPVHPAQAVLRIEQMLRAAVSAEEFMLRRSTFQEHGARLNLASDSRPRRILAVGDPDPRFLTLANVLEALDVDLTAALTPYTAFDYLHEREFDAVLLWGGEKRTDALSIASGIKRNSRLFHLPVVLYVNSQADMVLSEVFNRGVADIASPEAPIEETVDRILTLADSYRRQQQVRDALDRARHTGLMDPTTGLFTRDIFASHLKRISEAAAERRRTLSVCVLKVADRGPVAEARAGGWVDRAMPQIGAMISRLVRSEDTAARLAPEVFALALPATRLGEARLVSERIAAVIGCTAFHAGEDKTPFVVGFDIGEAEQQPGESPAALIERAARSVREPA